jgi:hypothetical protein
VSEHLTRPLRVYGDGVAMQNLSTALQLSGSVITLCGLLWAWHKVTGFLTTLRGAIGDRVSQLRTAMRGPTVHTVESHLTVGVKTSAIVVMGTPEERLAKLERQFATLDEQLQGTASTLRGEINEAIAVALQQFQMQSDSVRLRDIYPALGGLAVTITGYLVALFC